MARGHSATLSEAWRNEKIRKMAIRRSGEDGPGAAPLYSRQQKAHDQGCEDHRLDLKPLDQPEVVNRPQQGRRIGQLVQLATPNEIYENPKTRFIADFVGDISFVPAKINRQDGDYWLMDAAVPIYAACEHNLEAGKSITLAIRPEKITLTPEASGKINEFPVRIDDWAFYGAGTQYRVTGPGGIKLKLFQSHNQPSNAQLRPDQIETGFIHFAPESIIILEDK